MSRNCNNYRPIGSFGGGAATAPDTNPLTYCLLDSIDTSFNHGQSVALRGPASQKCQMFMSDYCSNDWNAVCEYAYQNKNNMVPNMLQKCDQRSDSGCKGLTEGQILLKNTAMKKYLSAMSSNCGLSYEPFDPTVASSPMVSYWSSTCQSRGSCVPVYEVNPTQIDNDPVMKKILSNPSVAINVLVNIYNTAVRKKTIDSLKGTNLYKFFQTSDFQNYVKRLTASKKYQWNGRTN